MRLTKEREAEFREAVKYEAYLRCEGAKELLDEIDYLRDSFLDMAVVMNSLTEERDQLRVKLDLAIEALEFYNKFPDRATVHSIGGGTAFYALAKILGDKK